MKKRGDDYMDVWTFGGLINEYKKMPKVWK